MGKTQNKVRVNWTLDPDVIRAVRAKVAELSKLAGVEQHESAVANKLLREVLKVGEETNGSK